MWAVQFVIPHLAFGASLYRRARVTLHRGAYKRIKVARNDHVVFSLP